MYEALVQIGLTDPQARAYIYLLEKTGATPPQLVNELKVTRTNAYKVLDSLVELGLARKSRIQKKLTYLPEDPIALASLAAAERNRVNALEEQTKTAILNLKRRYQASGQQDLKTYKGVEAVKNIYEQQAGGGQPIHFIRSLSDITFMGYEVMESVRRLSQKFGNKRYGITPDAVDAPDAPNLDKTTNLQRTWIDSTKYTSPVEWSVSNSELNIIIFDKEPSAIQIKNQVVAEAFTQLWRALDENLRANPDYKNLPRKASRRV